MNALETLPLASEHLSLWAGAIQKRNATGRGSSKKIELYGIRKLRELILELAVRGKLVPQNQEDEPASILLERIAAERKLLVKEKKIKRPKKLPEIEIDEQPFELPEGWAWARLNDLGEWGAGATPKRGNPEFYGGSIPWFKSGELTADYISESEETVTQTALEKTSLRYNKIGDVLVAMYGATIGKTAILNVRATTNQAVCACTPFTGFQNTYLLTLLKAYKSHLIGMGAGGAQPNISREKIIATVVAVPPEAEQPRIVAKVNELMSLCDQLEQQTESSLTAHTTLVENLLAALTSSTDAAELEQNWQRIAEHFTTLFTTEESIETLRRFILELAGTGKFSWVSYYPVIKKEDILDMATGDKEELLKKGEIKTEKIKPLEIPSPYTSVPESWITCQLNDVTCSLDHRRVPIKKSERSEGSVPYYGANGPVGFIGKHLFDEDLVLVVEDETFIGRTKPFSYRVTGKSWVNNHAHVLKCTSVILPDFLNILLSYYPFVPLTSGTTGRKKLTKNTLLQIPIILPSLEEQRFIISKVDSLMQVCDLLNEMIQQAQQTRLYLADAMVEEALS